MALTSNNQQTYTPEEVLSILMNLEKRIDYAPAKNGKMKRVKLPIPEEYGGGFVTGFGYEETVKKLITRVQNGVKIKSNAPLFKECWEKWIEIKEGQNRSPCTIANYKRQANDHLLPFFGSMQIDQITPDDIQSYFNSIINLSKSYSVQSRAVLSGIFNRAERMNYIKSNPMRFEYDRSTKVKEKVVLQDDDLLSVISQMDKLKDSDYLYVCFLCFTALRRGEILGLKWEDIDFDNQTIAVRRNVIFPDGTNDPIVKTPKDDSFGVIHLHSELLKRIIPYKNMSKGYIIRGSQRGFKAPISRSSFTKMWNRIKKTVDLKGATSHSFRATYASMMNAHCLHIDPKAIQGALRHKTPDLAIRVYTKENKNKTQMAEQEYDDWMQSQLKCVNA